MAFRQEMKYGVLVATFLMIGWLVNSIRLAGSHAEHRLHAMRLVTVAVQDYVKDRGKWPASWEDLKAVTASEGTMYSWPRDSRELQNYVEIDFDVTLDNVAKESPDRFSAIRPSGPTFQGYRDHVVSLLATVREKVDGRE